MKQIHGILDRNWMTNSGSLVEAFKQRIAHHLGVRHCVATCYGAIALETAIRALELEFMSTESH
jgi:dTDP-4-amino-4,6-dideoxyglucose